MHLGRLLVKHIISMLMVKLKLFNLMVILTESLPVMQDLMILNLSLVNLKTLQVELKIVMPMMKQMLAQKILQRNRKDCVI